MALQVYPWRYRVWTRRGTEGRDGRELREGYAWQRGGGIIPCVAGDTVASRCVGAAGCRPLRVWQFSELVLAIQRSDGGHFR
jgi:hypothetical protein